MKRASTILLTSAIDLLIDAVLGILWFTLMFTLWATGVSLLFAAGVGILLLLVTGYLSRGIGVVERMRAIALHDIEILPPVRRTTRVVGGWRFVAQAFVDLADPVTWRLLLHNFLSMLLGWVFVSLVAAVPAFATAVDRGGIPGLPDGAAAGWIAAAIALAVLLLYVAGAGALDRLVSPELLGSPRAARLEERVDTLTDARQGAVDAASTERRRIERDLHDGVQPRLVALAMTLGMARSRMESDPEGARRLLDQAHEDAKESITELRHLARGIQPAILADRGLDAALSAVASLTSVPTTVSVTLSRRPSAEIEAVLYFAVAEALTNVSKHAKASCCTVAVEEIPGGVRASISDDGVGGASRDGNPGGGLGGMHDRVRAAGGRLLTDSPAGGPTTVTVEVPCAL